MSSRQFSLWQKLVALAPLLLVAAYLPGEIMVRCHIDGSLRAGPCCDHVQEPGDQPGDAGPAFRDANCCDRELTAKYRPVLEAVRAGGDELLSVAALAPCLGAGIVAAAPPPRPMRAAQASGPPRGGPDIVLGKHAFLI